MGKGSKFLLGAILGATAAALLTPIAGQQARKNLKKAANKRGLNKLVERGSELLGSFLENIPSQPRRKTNTKK